MKYRVKLQPMAESDLEGAYLWAARHAPETAYRWLQRFQDAINTLATNPQRCSLAAEHRKIKRELRQLLFGRRPNVFRVLFVVENDVVKVVRIRRAARRALTRDELRDI